MANVEYLNLFLFFKHSIDGPVNVGLVAIEKMPKLAAFGCNRASVRMLFQAKNRFLETPVPFQGRAGTLDIDFVI